MTDPKQRQQAEEKMEAFDEEQAAKIQDMKLRLIQAELDHQRLREEATDGNPKTRQGLRKAPIHLVPVVPSYFEAYAFADGARKYGPFNWRDEAVSVSVYYAACRRHLDAFWDGRDVDPVSLCHELGHARACLGILLDALECGTLNDDRPTKGGLPAFLDHTVKPE